MSRYLSESYLRNISQKNPPSMEKTASFDLIQKALKIDESKEKEFDIFLSHSFNDAEIVRGIKLELESKGYSTYVDWIEEPSILSRDRITKKTAQTLKKRMNSCKVLIYAYSMNSSRSVWMPWELGYCDGLGKPIAVMPIYHKTPTKFDRQEYLELYPFITREKSNKGRMEIWINENVISEYIILGPWVREGKKPIERN